MRHVIWPIVALCLAVAAVAARATAGERHVVVVTPDNSDQRLSAVREALAFWNKTLADLKIGHRLTETKLLVAPPMTRALENHTRRIWLLAGRSVSKEQDPPPPKELVDLDGDIVVFLSKQQFFSFAWPIVEKPRYFIAIQTDRVDPLTYPNVTRNVVAHELGHALGLEHNGNTRTLMCGPCEHLLYTSERRVFFPVTAAERARLQSLYGIE